MLAKFSILIAIAFLIESVLVAQKDSGQGGTSTSTLLDVEGLRSEYTPSDEIVFRVLNTSDKEVGVVLTIQFFGNGKWYDAIPFLGGKKEEMYQKVEHFKPKSSKSFIVNTRSDPLPFWNFPGMRRVVFFPFGEIEPRELKRFNVVKK
jgi:hypothetical protein